MVNNFKQITEFLKFDNEDDFYHLQILKRKKENPEYNFESLRPYYDSESPEVMKRISNYEYYQQLMAYLNPNLSKEEAIEKAVNTKSPYEFQTHFMSNAIWTILKQSSSGLTWSGLENLDKNNFKDYREFKQRKTPNNNAYVYTGSKIPFKGSNLEGTWNVNRNNEWYYVVTSYNWYPIYLFINNQWYRVSNNWSSSTSKHLSFSDPNRKNYDSNLENTVIWVTPDEIKSIMDGKSLTDVKTNRVSNFKEKFAEALKSTSKLISIGWGEDKKKVKYTITDVSEENGKIKFDIRINKAGTVEGTNKMVVNPDGYIHPSPFSEDLEEGIAQRIMYDNKDYLSKDNTIFVFQHPN
jgi:hypothetical protein